MQRQDRIAFYLVNLSRYRSHFNTRCKWGVIITTAYKHSYFLEDLQEKMWKTSYNLNFNLYQTQSELNELLAYFAVSLSSSCSAGVRCSRSQWFSLAQPARLRGIPSRNFYPHSMARPCAAFPGKPPAPWPWNPNTPLECIQWDPFQPQWTPARDLLNVTVIRLLVRQTHGL